VLKIQLPHTVQFSPAVDIDESGGGSIFMFGVGVQAYGVGLQVAGFKSVVEGLTEGCPNSDCTIASQTKEFNQQQFDNFTFGKGQPPFM
jgi:hypothetical protein